MKYLIDTCILSELIKNKPDPNVENWFYSQNEDSLYISVISFGELRKGISKLTENSNKKTKLLGWVAGLEKRFCERIIDINLDVAENWGHIQGELEKKGNALPIIDSLIACTAITHSMIAVTRNIKDMARSGVELINPFDVL
ncbi:MAG: type II toxin-antitoxin system VapC family toxin [bacterium]|nr:type II toxin-antitoxin system VapC family toxin [bacterium]